MLWKTIVYKIWHWCISLHPFPHVNTPSENTNMLAKIFTGLNVVFKLYPVLLFFFFFNILILLKKRKKSLQLLIVYFLGGFKLVFIREIEHKQKKHISPPVACKQRVTEGQRALWVGPKFHHQFFFKCFVLVWIKRMKINTKFILTSLKWGSPATQHCTMSICSHTVKN